MYRVTGLKIPQLLRVSNGQSRSCSQNGQTKHILRDGHRHPRGHERATLAFFSEPSAATQGGRLTRLSVRMSSSVWSRISSHCRHLSSTVANVQLASRARHGCQVSSDRHSKYSGLHISFSAFCRSGSLISRHAAKTRLNRPAGFVPYGCIILHDALSFENNFGDLISEEGMEEHHG
ncbi:hypothetical protein BJX68DRAFT_24151 [Aspergillus pseudodeflectus]|uniref:Uncharacterized protein n=1 Tax=Aspergillus pseudodeflectus TaxID=176178 RepID=A0ABR4KTU4_9EURO